MDQIDTLDIALYFVNRGITSKEIAKKLDITREDMRRIFSTDGGMSPELAEEIKRITDEIAEDRKKGSG